MQLLDELILRRRPPRVCAQELRLRSLLLLSHLAFKLLGELLLYVHGCIAIVEFLLQPRVRGLEMRKGLSMHFVLLSIGLFRLLQLLAELALQAHHQQ